MADEKDKDNDEVEVEEQDDASPQTSSEPTTDAPPDPGEVAGGPGK